MQIGDPKKALVLAIVAIVIVGAAVFRAIPQHPKQMTEVPRPPAPPAATSPAAGNFSEDLPTTLTSEPFIKPPQRQANGMLDQPPETKEEHGTAVRVPPMQIAGELPNLPSAAPLHGTPSENTSPNRNLKQDTPVTATFDGVVQVTRRIAIITVSNKDQALQCGVGSLLEGYKVTNITESSVALQKGQNIIVLTVGKSAAL